MSAKETAMLPLEKCLELERNEFHLVNFSKMYVIPFGAGLEEAYVIDSSQFHHHNEHKTAQFACVSPTGDELLAECHPLLLGDETISLTVDRNGKAQVTIYGDGYYGVVRNYPGEANRKLYNTAQEALADAWLWLNERKKRND